MAESEPPDIWESEPPIEPLEGWYGGQVEHTGGNLFSRIWRTVEDYPDTDAEEFLEVGYNGDFNGVSVTRYQKEENIGYIFDSIVASREVQDGSDKLCAEVAQELMKSYS